MTQKRGSWEKILIVLIFLTLFYEAIATPIQTGSKIFIKPNKDEDAIEPAQVFLKRAGWIAYNAVMLVVTLVLIILSVRSTYHYVYKIEDGQVLSPLIDRNIIRLILGLSVVFIFGCFYSHIMGLVASSDWNTISLQKNFNLKIMNPIKKQLLNLTNSDLYNSSTTIQWKKDSVMKKVASRWNTMSLLGERQRAVLSNLKNFLNESISSEVENSQKEPTLLEANVTQHLSINLSAETSSSFQGALIFGSILQFLCMLYIIWLVLFIAFDQITRTRNFKLYEDKRRMDSGEHLPYRIAPRPTEVLKDVFFEYRFNWKWLVGTLVSGVAVTIILASIGWLGLKESESRAILSNLLWLLRGTHDSLSNFDAISFSLRIVLFEMPIMVIISITTWLIFTSYSKLKDLKHCANIRWPKGPPKRYSQPSQVRSRPNWFDIEQASEIQVTPISTGNILLKSSQKNPILAGVYKDFSFSARPSSRATSTAATHTNPTSNIHTSSSTEKYKCYGLGIFKVIVEHEKLLAIYVIIFIFCLHEIANFIIFAVITINESLLDDIFLVNMSWPWLFLCVAFITHSTFAPINTLDE